MTVETDQASAARTGAFSAYYNRPRAFGLS
jgi:hypothetical protein